ncbi:MAG: hypothetical protein II290_02800 [Oscillospiraceae bacterium]|nr:hypothetical protein [Oscillospiraceae bacterium]
MNEPAIQTKTCPVCGQVFRTTYPEKIYCDYTCYVKARNRRKYLSKKDRRRKERKC